MRFLNAGESHGKALCGIIEGMPSNLKIDFEMINNYLKLRQGGYGRGGRMKIETDKMDIMSGVRGSKTTGAPVSFLVWNKDWENWSESMSAYDDAKLEEKRVTRARPGHADLSGAIKYRQDDIRNILERASARETATKVVQGGFAINLLKEFGVEVIAHVVEIGSVKAKEVAHVDSGVYEDPVYCADDQASKRMVALIDEAKEKGESLGGVVEVRIKNMPIGVGSSMNGDRKLDSRLAGALMGVQAIKGVEVGLGFEAARRFGSKVHDEIEYDEEKGFLHKTNNAGGIEGGMTNGEEIIVRAAMKPIPTLYNPLKSVDIFTKEEYLAAIERSDVCAVPAASIVCAAVAAWEVANCFLEKFAGDSIEEIRENYNRHLEYVKNF